jgi:hypothetical protein
MVWVAHTGRTRWWNWRVGMCPRRSCWPEPIAAGTIQADALRTQTDDVESRALTYSTAGRITSRSRYRFKSLITPRNFCRLTGFWM